jgi:hypothetical protein
MMSVNCELDWSEQSTIEGDKSLAQSTIEGDKSLAFLCFNVTGELQSDLLIFIGWKMSKYRHFLAWSFPF